MKYSGSSIVTTYQVGSYVYFTENDIPLRAKVIKTVSTKVGSGSVVVAYILEGYANKTFPESELYVSKAALKTSYTAAADALP